ncbi:MAG: DUF4340 domain-containing protein [Opitutus sp.]|nr:DUF4340 domain-containing protein [Opitutus sp.]
MKLRTLLIVVAVLAALSAAVFVARRPTPPPSADARLGQPLAERAAVEKAAKLRLTDQGKTVLLTRQPDGTWRVASYHDLPADFSKLTTFVSSLTDAKLDRLVSTNAERIARLEFKDTQIALLDATDKEIWSVTLGKNAEAGGGRFLRYGAEQKAYLANLNAYLDTESKNWASAELLTLKAEDIAKIEIPFTDGGTVTATRAKKDDAWAVDQLPTGQKLKADKISSLLSSLSSIRFSDTNDLTDANAVAAKASERLFKLETFDKKIIKIGLGRKPEEKKLKPPTAGADGKTGLAALGTSADLLKKEADGKPAESAKPLAPEFETIPAGPVFVTISHGDGTAAPINALMQKRAFQIAEYTFTGLPQKSDELFEPAPVAAPATPAEKKPDEPKQP